MKRRTVQARLQLPSRELATQIYQAARQLASSEQEILEWLNYVGGTVAARRITS